MRKMFWWVIVLILVAVGGLGYWGYEKSGVGTFSKRMRQFEGHDLVPAEKKAEVDLLFDGDEDGQYAGALLRVSKNGANGFVCHTERMTDDVILQNLNDSLINS